ncbi:MarR family winged helix-turn-helix transcriptional regulator [Paracoccus aestuariivivens]|uniref:MarR family transcriptional regulator n=1 Tax=Paracoccus aestuariivivens TaxID=1820333 RepID=A0A6L6JDI3_9RHOB|nr:MarR family transcriptional regulator [Paracoccus aestuariivivens]MTH79248.1 MarR family transcriptional regulator [Paracoccus aestuariivivens]
MHDPIDHRRAQWARELPDLDTGPMDILGRINRLASIMAPEIEATFREFGLERGEFDVIATLRRAGPPYRLSPTKLYSALMITSGGLTHRLARLAQAGLIQRVPDPEDGRGLLVQLTERGRQLAETAFREDMRREALLLHVLAPQDRTDLQNLLRRLGTILGDK